MRIVNPRALLPIRQLNPAVSPQVETVLMRALELQPENRFPDASAMLAALYTGIPRAASLPPAQRIQNYPAPPAKQKHFSPALLFVGGFLLFISLLAAILGLRGILSARQDSGTSHATPVVTGAPPTAPSSLKATAPVGTLTQATVAPDTLVTSLPTVTPLPRTPAGTLRLYFDSDRSGDWSIYSIALDGTQETTVIRSAGTGYGDTACNPQIGQIAYDTDRDGNWEIYTADWTGANQVNRTSHPANEEEPAWSADGRYLAFKSDRTGNWDIWILDLLTQALTNVTSHPADDRHPTWSPDGEWLAFISDRGSNWDIYKVRTNGAELTPVVATPAEERFPSWSPDGRSLVYHARPAANADSDIYVWNLAESRSQRLTFAAGDDWAAAWSPDGKQIAFVSEQDGNNEIYVMDRDGRNLRRLTIDSRGDTWPCWMIVP
ncbi:MAG: translocation protein TolB [Chloroflexi bacterium ADurb.Bin360]|nr:MAG: translocation protein TolB [Chloroflexi bacterium ADurb.Bin360]